MENEWSYFLQHVKPLEVVYIQVYTHNRHVTINTAAVVSLLHLGKAITFNVPWLSTHYRLYTIPVSVNT